LQIVLITVVNLFYAVCVSTYVQLFICRLTFTVYATTESHYRPSTANLPCTSGHGIFNKRIIIVGV